MTMTATNVNTAPLYFDESYGELPKILFKAIRRYGVTPAEYWMMVEVNDFDFQEAFDHILFNVRDGLYRAPLAR